MTCCNFDLDAILLNLHNNIDLQAIVWLYKWLPAIANQFSETPDVKFITFCELTQPNQKVTWDWCVISGYVDFDIKIVMEAECTSRKMTRQCYNELYCALLKHTDDQIGKVVYRDSSWILYMWKRPYIAATFRFMLR